MVFEVTHLLVLNFLSCKLIWRALKSLCTVRILEEGGNKQVESRQEQQLDAEKNRNYSECPSL